MYRPLYSGESVIGSATAACSAGSEISLWRRAWRDKILPAVAQFQPDLIIISAGFDAHKKDELNFHFIGVTERDYYWLTQQLVSLANSVCGGRLVSALEGGYRTQGGIVSAFSRSVAAHVRALKEVNNQASNLQQVPTDTVSRSLLSCPEKTRRSAQRVYQMDRWSVQEWSPEEAKRERAIELQRKRELLAAKRANAAKAAERAAERERERLAALAAATLASAADHPANGTVPQQEPIPAAAAKDMDMVSELTHSPDNGGDRKRRCNFL